jgi:hypothetical protein
MNDLSLRIIWWCGGLLAALAPLLLLIVSLRRKVRREEACCAKCRYSVRGLPSHICPECGSDLRGSGTIRRFERRAIGRTPRLVLWSAVLLVAWWLLSGPMGGIPSRLLWPVVPKKTSQFICLNVGENAGGNSDREWMRTVVQTVVICDGFTATPPPKEVFISPRTLYDGTDGVPPGPEGLHISLADGTCFEEGAFGQRLGSAVPFTAPRLRRFLQSNRLPNTDAHVQLILRIVTSATSNAATGAMASPPAATLPTSPVTIWSDRDGTAEESLVSINRIVNLSLLGVWLAGVLVLWRPLSRQGAT